MYCKKIREIYGDVPIAIGGLEASLRRFAHYDYWDDCVRPSILVDSTADILMFGMSIRLQSLHTDCRMGRIYVRSMMYGEPAT